MASITEQEDKVDDGEDEIKNIYDICGIPGLFKHILIFLKVKSILNLSESCLVKNLNHTSFNECVTAAIRGPKQLFELYRRYRLEFEGKSALVCACEKERMNDVVLFVNLHRFHKYIEMKGVKEGNMTLKEYVNQFGRNSNGLSGFTPLMIAAAYENFQIVKYLIEQGEADPNIANSGFNALHYAAGNNNKKDTKLIEFLLTNMPLNSINKKSRYGGETPLDYAYKYNKSPIKQAIIDLIRSKGGKRGREL